MGQPSNVVRRFVTGDPLSGADRPASWSMLKYPLPKEKRVRLARLYYHISTTPGISTQVLATCADGFKALTRSKNKVTIEDMRLPWFPIFQILKSDLFLTRREFEYTSVLPLRL